MAVKQDINVGMVAFTGVVGAMLLLIIIWGVHGWYSYEVDLLRQQRNNADENVDWNRLKAEQYANLADPVGNETIFAAQVPAVNDANGYRWTDGSRQSVAVPIHEAMAEIVRQNGGDATADQMKAVDAGFTSIVNEAYVDLMMPASAPAEATQGAAATQ